MEVFIYTFYSLFLLLVGTLGFLSLYLTLYVWEDPKRLEEIASPKNFLFPQKSFTVLIPARHEERVIAQTIRSVARTNYPSNLIEIFVICEAEDYKTIKKAQQTIVSMNLKNVKIITFNDEPINKPHALNKGLAYASNDIVVIFDAEDEVNSNIFNVANTLFLSKNPDVIQAGVQLMNFDSYWFSVHNVLEYYLWFKSRMHFYTKVGIVPLGGNTVFFKIKKLRGIGGWDETCLTEDAEIGIRLCATDAKIISTYDAAHITKEETPHSLIQFIRQRTRWNQGFLQILIDGYWTEYDSFTKRLLAFYTLSFPITQTFLLALIPTTLFLGLDYKLPLPVSLLSFIPLLLLTMHCIINMVALSEFIKEQQLPNKKRIYFVLLVTYIPYQMLLAIGAVRATFREMLGMNDWEKTFHSGEHRISLQPVAV